MVTKVTRITKHLMENPSYLKWGTERLAAKFGTRNSVIASIVKSLAPVKENYLRNL